METERRISTGIDGLDEAIDYLRPGDTVVWQCDTSATICMSQRDS